MSAVIPAYLLSMVRQRAPAGAPVVPGSTPVVSFGNPAVAEVATLGINPSKIEFVVGGQPLPGKARRLATLESLGSDDVASLTDAQVGRVIEECAAYFSPNGNPYRRWFDPLDQLLRDGVGASFYDGTACHLDLVQWATDPVWGRIANPAVQAVLLQGGLPHLRAQLRHSNIRLLLLNGRTVLNQVGACGLASLAPVGSLPLGRFSCSLYVGTGEGVRFLGWSTNLQSSRGVTNAFKAELAAWLAEHASGLETVAGTVRSTEEAAVTNAEWPLDDHGYVIKGTTVTSKQELAGLLSRWLQASGAATVGDIGSFGGSPCIRIELGEVTAVLNADTKRSAVKDCLEAVRDQGTDLVWPVVANRRGRVNKVLFGDERLQTPGWFCYLTEPLTVPTDL